jgi:hypothetical protein
LAAKFLLVSDIHGSAAALETIVAAVERHRPDAVLIAGDLTTFGPPEFADEIRSAVDCIILAVTGNCDLPATRARISELGIDACDRIVRVGEVDVAGIAWLGRKRIFEGLGAGLVAAIERRDAARPMVILSHCPALGTLDEASPGLHAGSEAVADLVRRHGPAALLTGHVHEAAGTGRIGRTLCVNAGPATLGRAAIVRVVDGAAEATLL